MNMVKVYKRTALHSFIDAILDFCKGQGPLMKKCGGLEWSGVEFLRSILLFLYTQSWKE